MTVQTTAQTRLIDAIHAAGFSGQAADIMYAIDEAESGGNAWAYNPNASTGDNSYGLSQINMLGSLGPARRAQWGLSSNDQLFDPVTNERAAYALSGGGADFSPWSTFKSGAYRQFLGQPETDVISYTPEHGSPHTDPNYTGAFPAPTPGNFNGPAGSASTLAGGSSSSGGISWSDLLPWNWGSGLSGVTNAIIAFVLKLAVIGGGIVLILMGAWQASRPARAQAAAAAPLAAVAA